VKSTLIGPSHPNFATMGGLSRQALAFHGLVRPDEQGQPRDRTRRAYWFRQLEERILKTAPKGRDVTSWRY
jgi:hypothetical protein